MYDARFGRWLSADPDFQFTSPYVGLGNSPVNSVDINGGYVYIIGRRYSKRIKKIIDFLYNTHYGKQLLDKYGLDPTHDIYITAGQGRRINSTEESGGGTLNLNSEFVTRYANAKGQVDLSLFKNQIAFTQFQVFNGTDITLSRATESISFVYVNTKVLDDAPIYGAEVLGHEFGAHLKKVPDGRRDLSTFNNGKADHATFGSDRALIKQNLPISLTFPAGQLASQLKTVRSVNPGIRLGATIASKIFSVLLFRGALRGGPRFVPTIY